MNELALFAGAGGGILGGHLLGWRTVCAVEIEDYPRRVLLQRQADGFLPRFPIWDDVRTFDGKPWRGKVDVISGGFPCQDISIAGRGGGLDGARSGLWSEMSRIIGEVRPQYVFVENSPMLIVRGLGTVLGNLSEMGYDCKWGIISASNVGANHQRERIWIVGNTNNYGYSSTEISSSIEQRSNNSEKRQKQTCEFERSSEQHEELAYSSYKGLQGCERIRDKQKEDGRGIKSTYGTTAKCSPTYGTNSNWWESEPNVGRVVDGLASRVDRLKAIGNGQVPLCAATAWSILSEIH
jgi:DNA (cytosine-5)-methyltransferase 1